VSTFNETITLTNAGDIAKARGGFIPQAEIRSITLEACVDTAARTLVINEETRAALGLELESSVFSTLADGTTQEYAMTEGVKLRWKNREHVLPACVVPTAGDILLGALPMEALDVYADPVDECLKGRHGDKQIYPLK
jgi:predicted aspartyl protease